MHADMFNKPADAGVGGSAAVREADTGKLEEPWCAFVRRERLL